MLELSSQRKELAFTLDGEPRSLPISLNLEEMLGLYRLQADAGGSPDGPEAARYVEWFASYARAYLGDKVDSMPGEAVVALMGEWFSARERAGEPGPGEPQASPAP